MKTVNDKHALSGFEARLLEELVPMVERRTPSPIASAQPSRRRWWLAGAAAALALAAAIALPAILPVGTPGGPVRARGVAFHGQDGYVDATISDPAASAAEMRASFAQHGFDIRVYLDPVSPSLVGTIPAEPSASDQIAPIWGPEGSCSSPGGLTRCQIGIRIPLDFTGHAAIEVGRAAQPGETYVSANDAFARGEDLHCSGLRGMMVADAQPILVKLGVTVIWRTGGGDPDQGVDPATIGDQFITDALAFAAPSTEMIWVGRNAVAPGAELAAYQQSLDQGC